MAGWWEFIAALAVFFASHAIPVRPPVKPWLVARLGPRGYLLAYSVLSIAILAWLIGAAARAPHVGILPPWPVLRWVPLVVMLPVSALVVGGVWRQNPLSFGGLGPIRFDPDAPGLLAVSRHPLLLALLLWALAHLLANGDLAHVILFGLFAGFAAMGMALIDRRMKRQLGAAAWERLARNTARLSLAGFGGPRRDAWPVLAALALYVGLIVLHLPVIGVSPLP